jgi:hypothetical protein
MKNHNLLLTTVYLEVQSGHWIAFVFTIEKDVFGVNTGAANLAIGAESTCRYLLLIYNTMHA